MITHHGDSPASATRAGKPGRARVWVVSPFSDTSSPETSDRYRYVCQRLLEEGAEVTQFVSGFDHGRKARRARSTVPWRLVEVFEPGYPRNVSLWRLLSHAVFDLLIGFYFLAHALRRGAPDTLLIAVPHNGAACVAEVFARAVRARVIVDVHDTWPESILGVRRLSGVGRLGYRAWKWLADLALRSATATFAESIRYAERADAVRVPVGRSKAHPIYLGGDSEYYGAIRPAAPPDALAGARFLVAYVGTLGENYDLDCLVDAFAMLQAEAPDVGLMLLGTGEREAALRSRIASQGLRAWVSGRLEHRTLISFLKLARVGLNCFKPLGNVAYSYKLNDYFLTGVPVINSLPGETERLIAEHGLGLNYAAGNAASLLEALRASHVRWASDAEWGAKVRRFAATALDRRKTYAPLITACLDLPPSPP